MKNLRWVHRLFAVLVVIFALNLGVTGVIMQSVDVKSYFTHAPGTDPSMVSLRESFNGPPNYEVLGAGEYGGGDYEAAPFPAGADFAAMLAKSVPAARIVAHGQPLRYVELRMLGGKPQMVAALQPNSPSVDTDTVRIDPATGALVEHKIVLRGPPGIGPQPFRNAIKDLHRLGYLGYMSSVFDTLAGICISTLLFTGVWMYFRLFDARKQIGKASPFWLGTDWWRGLHRSIAIVAAIFLAIIAVSGTWIAFEGLYFRTAVIIYQYVHGQRFSANMSDASSPLQDRDIPGMLRVTLVAKQEAAPDADMKVIRLRYFSGMPQGVIVIGDGNDTRQLVFNTDTGKSVLETEPGYPPSFLPLGWQVHQWVKNIHRGDYLALPGKTVPGHLLDLLAGLSLLYLTVSGAVMYVMMWWKRKSMGRSHFFWS